MYYDGGGRVQRDWNRHEEREIWCRIDMGCYVGLLASRPAETTRAPRGPCARRVQEYLHSTSPRAFALSVDGARVVASVECRVNFHNNYTSTYHLARHFTPRV